MTGILSNPASPVLVDFQTALETLAHQMDGVSDSSATGVSAVQQTQVGDFAASDSHQAPVDVLANLSSAVCVLHSVAQLTNILTQRDIPETVCPFKGFEDEVLLWLEAFERESTLKGWNQSMKWRAALSRIQGPALAWHRYEGRRHVEWKGWCDTLVGAFGNSPLLEPYQPTIVDPHVGNRVDPRCVKDIEQTTACADLAEEPTSTIGMLGRSNSRAAQTNDCVERDPAIKPLKSNCFDLERQVIVTSGEGGEKCADFPAMSISLKLTALKVKANKTKKSHPKGNLTSGTVHMKVTSKQDVKCDNKRYSDAHIISKNCNTTEQKPLRMVRRALHKYVFCCYPCRGGKSDICANELESINTFRLSHNMTQQRQSRNFHEAPYHFRRRFLKNAIPVLFAANNSRSSMWEVKRHTTSNSQVKTEWRPSNRVRLKVYISSAKFLFDGISKVPNELYFVGGECDDEKDDSSTWHESSSSGNFGTWSRINGRIHCLLRLQPLQ